MCSFCLRSAAEVDKLIAGPGIYVCDACVARCVEILSGPPAESTDPVVTWVGLDEDGMLSRLPRMARVADQVEDSMSSWVGELRRRGVTWQRIGDALGMTRQSAWMRFADRAVSS
jgi:uncharacterized membrane protein YccC